MLQSDIKGARPPSAFLSGAAPNMRPEKKTDPAPLSANSQPKKVPRRSSKPIINWFQRKLTGSGKTKRTTENVPLRVSDLGSARNNANGGRQMGRKSSSPLPVQNAHFLRQQAKPDGVSVARRKTRSTSLHGTDEELRDLSLSYCDDGSLDQSSLNRESIWSPASAIEADDDASVRPLPPSSPPSPSPSRSSSSYLSDPRTFKSMAASTKPTTLLSIDLNGNGMAHIAQAPTPPPAQLSRFAPHVRQSSLTNAGLLSSTGSITFSTLNTAPSGPSSTQNINGYSFDLNTRQPSSYGNQVSAVQAPLHTNHHPRNNPRPSSPPLDNASMLTLASSAFGMPNRLGAFNYTPSALGDSLSHYGASITFLDAESASHYVPGDDDRLEERDFDASVRALRPRSSRRGSWESEASRWSARVQGVGTPSLAREQRSLFSNSVRAEHFSSENVEAFETADEQPVDDSAKSISLSETFSDGAQDSEKMALSLNSQDVGYETISTIPRSSTDTIAQPVVSPVLEESASKLKLENDLEVVPSNLTV